MSLPKQSRSHGGLWAIVLAGGQGVRLRPLIRHVCGDERPKQYATLIGFRSLLGHTLDRVALAIPRERTALVTHRAHAGYIAAELADGPRPWVLAQPQDRGTAAGVLFPAHWIQWRDPDAIVVAFPCDHFILEEAAFMHHVMEAVSFVGSHPRRLVLLGARATGPETEYGWIEPGKGIGEIGEEPVTTVRQFWEKPSKESARACFAKGWLWNTFVFVAKVATILEAGRQCLPDLTERLARIAPFTGTELEPWAIDQAYAFARGANFSRAVLESCPASLAVSRLPALTWSDWGTPERVLQCLRSVGISPPWLTAPARPRSKQASAPPPARAATGQRTSGGSPHTAEWETTAARDRPRGARAPRASRT